MVLRNVEIAYNGCSEAYPAGSITMATCWAQQAGGYGDGFGLATSGGHWVAENCYVHHNISDGFDFLYLDATASLEVRGLIAEGNAGNQLKLSGNALVENSLLVGNCAYFADSPLMVGGDHCRAYGDTLALDLHRGSSIRVINNTLTGQGDCLLEVGCNDSDSDHPQAPDCNGTEKVTIRNTLFAGNTRYF